MQRSLAEQLSFGNLLFQAALQKTFECLRRRSESSAGHAGPERRAQTTPAASLALPGLHREPPNAAQQPPATATNYSRASRRHRGQQPQRRAATTRKMSDSNQKSTPRRGRLATTRLTATAHVRIPAPPWMTTSHVRRRTHPARTTRDHPRMPPFNRTAPKPTAPAWNRAPHIRAHLPPTSKPTGKQIATGGARQRGTPKRLEGDRQRGTPKRLDGDRQRGTHMNKELDHHGSTSQSHDGDRQRGTSAAKSQAKKGDHHHSSSKAKYHARVDHQPRSHHKSRKHSRSPGPATPSGKQTRDENNSRPPAKFRT